MVNANDDSLAGKTIDKNPINNENNNKKTNDRHQIRGGRKLKHVITKRTKTVESLQMELAKIGVNKNKRILQAKT